jgi:hypothetical protein
MRGPSRSDKNEVEYVVEIGLCEPMCSNVRAAAEQYRGCIVVRRSQRKHNRPCTCWVNANCIRHILQRCLDSSVIIKQHCIPVRLYKQPTRWKQPCQSKQVHRECPCRDWGSHKWTFGRKELVGWIVLICIIYVSSIFAPTKLNESAGIPDGGR